jgi:hypothetical protein
VWLWQLGVWSGAVYPQGRLGEEQEFVSLAHCFSLAEGVMEGL